MKLARALACAAVAAGSVALADPAPGAPGGAADPTLPSSGVLVCGECAGVTLAGSPVRSAPGKPVPSCGVMAATVELRSGGGTVQAGVPVAVVREPGSDWVRIRAASGEAGYVPSGSVTAGESDGCRPLAAAPIALRRSANPGGAVLVELPPETEVTFGTASVPGWLRVKGPAGEVGYVPAANVWADGGPAWAPLRRNVFTVRLGLLAPTSGALAGWGRGLPVELSAGRQVGEFVRLEASAGWQALSVDADTALGAHGILDGRVRAVPFFGRVRLVAPAGRAEVTASLGLGVGFVSWKATPVPPTQPPFPPSPPAGEERGSDSVFLREAGLGVAVPVSPGARLGLELRYLVGDTKVAGADAKLDAVVALAGLTWEW